MNFIKRAFNFIHSRGISEKFPEDNQLTGRLNIISFITAIGSLGIFIINYLFVKDVVYTSLSLLVTVTYLTILILHHFHLIQQAKIYFSAILPLWYVAATLCIGGHFSQSMIALTTIVITFLMYKKRVKLRNSLILYNILLFVLPSLWITLNEPFFGVRDYPIDEIVVFILALGWISIVFFIYESNTEEYIDSLQEKNKELVQKTTELERFNYIASHDLKSPLRNITSFLNLIKRDLAKGKNENIEEYIEYTLTSAYQMNELVKGVLEISTMGRDNTINYQTLDLNKTLGKAIRNLQEDIHDAKAEISTEKLSSCYGNESDFIVIFQNLIQNGLKYNKSANPKIVVSSDIKEKHQIIHFKDNGIGISEEYHNQIFEFFKRLHNSQEYPGTGLGLGLCKKIINKYDGDISVDSKVGEYSTFSIRLPLLENEN